MKTRNIWLILVSTLFFAACSDSNDNKVSGDHVWKEQTATIDKAKEVEGILKKSAEDQAKALEKQMQ
ncbi:MAG: PBP1b-binding outer membrane lipoprotein LpoB [Gammaproteobacteria bacterium]|jgi:PBP1b-binding outer membrane lipoprotein LpoB